MDKQIEPGIRAKRKKKLVIISLAIVAVIALVSWSLRLAFVPTLQQKEFVTAVVETGDIENTINATGELLPEFEEVITSPINASVQSTQLDAGASVQGGEQVLTLDKSAAQSEYEQLKFQLETKRNSIRKLKLELDKSYFDIKSNNDIKQLRIGSLEADVENAKRLFNAGGGTREDIEKAELALKVAKLEKQQLENEIRSKQQTMQLEIRQSELDAAIQENALKELERKLTLAEIHTSRAGVITWINKNIGAMVAEGDPLVRIADLSSFKVSGSISDNYLGQVSRGMDAIISINDTLFRGTVSNIHPTVQNGIVTFDIQLQNRNHPLYRPNMKVEVYVVTGAEKQVMRVANGAAFKGANLQNIFVVQDGKAIRKTIHTGMSNFDYVQLKDNVKPGDVVIISDMSRFKNATEIRIEK